MAGLLHSIDFSSGARSTKPAAFDRKPVGTLNHYLIIFNRMNGKDLLGYGGVFSRFYRSVGAMMDERLPAGFCTVRVQG
ncbi:MAG: hypothetical protein R3F53_07695 [Gammaproteobacteria bacterium]